MENKDHILADSALNSSPSAESLPDALQQFYASFKDETAGEYTIGVGVGIEDIPFGPVSITVDNTRISLVFTKDYEATNYKYQQLLVLQGYAQVSVFDRFYATCIMIGKHSPENAGGIVTIVDHLSRTEEEREELERKKIDEVKIHPSFYAEIYNDPINDARNTCGIYIIVDSSEQTINCETVFQAIGIADFADNAAVGLAIALSANVNTFTDTMTFSVAGSLRLAASERTTIAGEIGILNGKLNAIGFSIKNKLMIATEVFFTKGNFSVRGFQEPKISFGLGAGIAIGNEIKIPEGLSGIKKVLFPNLTKFYPLELSVNGEINPIRNYYTLSGEGVFIGNFSVSAAFTYDDGDISAEFRAGTVRNNYLNGSLSVDFHKKRDNWSLHGNFNCSLTIDIGSFFGVAVSGGVDILLNSQNYTVSNTQYNRKDLTVSVFGMGKIKVLFSFSISVNKTWVFHLSNTQLSGPDLLMKSISAGDTSMLETTHDVLVCESKDIAEIQLPQRRLSGDVIETKSWQFDEQCSASGLVKIQIAAEYTLVDSDWRLTHSDGNTVTVYTAENSAGVVNVQEFTHNYFELQLDTPDAGSWTLEILGDRKNSGGIYLDALQDEKFITQLEILEQTDSAIKFRYSAFTGAADDTTLVRLCAEEISSDPGYNPYSGIIAYLEETENGEFIWEIPEEFRHNAQYRFYISAASSNAGCVTESDGVEIFLKQQSAELECSWDLAYNADNTNTVTAYITITNSGAENTLFQWEILDYTNNDSVDTDTDYFGNTSEIAEVIASGSGLEIKGNSSITFEQLITITDELRDNPSSLLLTVTQETDNKNNLTKNKNDEIYADDTDEITFSAVTSENCQQQKLSWQSVDGAVSYILHYALEGDWENGGVYVNNISGTSYVLSVAPGEYAYRVIAIGSDGKTIGTWSEEQQIDVLFHTEQTLRISADINSSRSQLFSLNDGIYSLSGVDLHNFTGTLKLFRNDCVKTGENEDGITLTQKENNILTLKIINGILQNPVSEILLDHGDYFWEWTKTKNSGDSAFDITLDLSGEVFSVEQKDREIISIGEDTVEMPLIGGIYAETLEGEVGFCNKDAIYRYMTDAGGELSVSVKKGTVFESDVNIFIYVQNSSDGEFDCVKTVKVNGGEYTKDTVIFNNLPIINNFYVQIASPDNGRGKYNTDYSFDLSFDAFEGTAQSEDILVVNGNAVSDWIGYRNEAHSYLLQINENGSYAIRLNGDADDAVLKICKVNGTVIKKKRLDTAGKAFIDDIYLESGNYFVVVDSADHGKGKYNTDYILKAVEMKNLCPEIDNCGSADGVSWNAVSEASGYKVEYSQNNFKNILYTETVSTGIDFFNLPSGVWQWRVSIIGEELSNTEQFTVDADFAAQKLVSEANGCTDIFFVCCNDKWSANYSAQHTGISGIWAGTNERINLVGKNKIDDIFEGSSDANILVLTDDKNGDALFVDDIFTALPGSLTEQQSRIAQIDEIRAGLGDDIVDMTSQRFTYIGDGVKIYGGLGNDTIWANNGSNTLFGDAGHDRMVGGKDNDVLVGGSGNDRMHGGGGDDTFCFGGNWGKDTVEQLDGGKITLWFEFGSENKWNADTFTYTDGNNSVKVSGVSNDDITLIFGDNGSLRYGELAAAGCFEDAAGEKIFEDKDKNFLA